MALNAKQKLFVAAYLVKRSATQAVIAAGFTKNENSARVMGTRLLANVSVQEAIAHAIDAQAKRLEITADRVTKQIALTAFDVHATRFEQLKALELLGKHFKLFTDVVENTGNTNSVQVVLTMPANGSEAKTETKQKKARK